jgi:hypothetical protein
MTFEERRFAWAMMKMREGVPNDIAVMSALAAHPLDDSPPGPIPGRALEKRIRKMSRRYAKEVPKVGENHVMLGKLVGSTLKVYESLAIEAQNSYYINRYATAVYIFTLQLITLGHITGPKVTPELQALADQYAADRFRPGDSQ